MVYVLGIDIGTSGCKCTLLNEKGKPVVTRSKELQPRISVDGTVEQDPNEWYQAAIDCLKEFRELDGIDLHRIEAVSATGQMQGITLIGKNGEPVRPSILWNDMRSESHASALNESFEEAFRRNITFACAPSLTVSKIAWLKDQEPDSWRRTEKFILASNFITYKLTGRITTDTNNIIYTGLNDTRNNGWSDELLDCCEVEREKVPELIGCFDQVGAVTARAAEETGLKEGVTVIAGGGDGAAEGYSVGLAGSERLKIRLGTAADIGMVIGLEEVDRSQTVWPGQRDVLPDHLLISTYTKACAGSLKWVRDVFYSELPAESSTYSFMDREAEDVEIGASGLLYHPYLSGENAPYFDNSLRAKFTGMNMGHRRKHFVRAAYEGVSFSVRDVVESVSEFKNAKEYVFVGGGTKSGLWTSVLADVLGVNATIPKYCDASYGVALMAGHAVKLFDSGEVIREAMQEASQIGYREQNHLKYNEMYKKYKELAGK